MASHRGRKHDAAMKHEMRDSRNAMHEVQERERTIGGEAARKYKGPVRVGGDVRDLHRHMYSER